MHVVRSRHSVILGQRDEALPPTAVAAKIKVRSVLPRRVVVSWACPGFRPNPNPQSLRGAVMIEQGRDKRFPEPRALVWGVVRLRTSAGTGERRLPALLPRSSEADATRTFPDARKRKSARVVVGLSRRAACCCCCRRLCPCTHLFPPLIIMLTTLRLLLLVLLMLLLGRFGGIDYFT